MNFRSLACTLGLLTLPSLASAANYAGNYEGAKISVTISPAGPAYTGEIRMADKKFPLTAKEDADHLAGAFTAAGSQFSFTATQHGDDLTLITDGVTYQLHRRNVGNNPLEGVAPTSQPADILSRYVAMNTSDVGKSVARELPNAKTTRAALEITFADLARYFGERPKILGAYEDGRDHTSAFVSYSSKLNDQPIKGFVTAKLHEQGAVVFIVFAKADCTHAEWAALTAHPERDIKAEMAEVPLKPYAFPDQTGAIGLAEGWTTNAQTESNLLVTGPAGQKIRMAFGGTFYTPEAARRNAVPNVPVAPYTDDPAAALANIIRGNSAVSQRNGGPSLAPERLIRVVPVPARNPGGKGAQITYEVTITDKSGPKHYRSMVQFEFSPLRNGAWNYYASFQVMSAPDTFDKDLPVMLAQVFSLSENADVVMAKSHREMEAARKLAEAQRAANEKIAQAHYDHNKSVEDNWARQKKEREDADVNQQKRLRMATDFDETIRGERTVEDTRTGEKTSVNLADVHDIVDKANYLDPGRYREIPLRDEFYPLAGHENEPDYIGR